MKKTLQTTQNRTFFTVEYIAEHNWIYCNWIGYISEPSLKLGCDLLLQMLKETQCPFVLNDNRSF